MSDPAYIMTGLALSIGSFNAQITDLSHDGISRSSEESTHFASVAPDSDEFGGREFVFGTLADGGSLSISGNHSSDIVPPTSAVKGTITITFPLGSGETTGTIYTGEGAMTDYSYSGSVEGKAAFSATVKFSGVITVTPAVTA